MGWLLCDFLSRAHRTHLRIVGSFKLEAESIPPLVLSWARLIHPTNTDLWYYRHGGVFPHGACVLVLPSRIAHIKTGGALMSNQAKMQSWCCETAQISKLTSLPNWTKANVYMIRRNYPLIQPQKPLVTAPPLQSLCPEGLVWTVQDHFRCWGWLHALNEQGLGSPVKWQSYTRNSCSIQNASSAPKVNHCWPVHSI